MKLQVFLQRNKTDIKDTTYHTAATIEQNEREQTPTGREGVWVSGEEAQQVQSNKRQKFPSPLPLEAGTPEATLAGSSRRPCLSMGIIGM